MPAKKTTTRTATADDSDVETMADPEPTEAQPAPEPPGTAGERFRAAVLAVGDGASGERIEQLLNGT